MFLRAKIRRKDGKEHRTFSIVENRRVSCHSAWNKDPVFGVIGIQSGL